MAWVNEYIKSHLLDVKYTHRLVVVTPQLNSPQLGKLIFVGSFVIIWKSVNRRTVLSFKIITSSTSTTTGTIWLNKVRLSQFMCLLNRYSRLEIFVGNSQ